MNQTVKIRLSISGMSCAGCVAAVENALRDIPGVTEANVNFAEHTALVSGTVDSQTLIDAVTHAGYAAAELASEAAEQEKEAIELEYYRNLLRKAMVATSSVCPCLLAA